MRLLNSLNSSLGARVLGGLPLLPQLPEKGPVGIPRALTRRDSGPQSCQIVCYKILRHKKRAVILRLSS